MTIKTSSKRSHITSPRVNVITIIIDFNIEHSKHELEKAPITNSLLKEIPTAGNQAAGWGDDPSGFLI